MDSSFNCDCNVESSIALGPPCRVSQRRFNIGDAALSFSQTLRSVRSSLIAIPLDEQRQLCYTRLVIYDHS